MDTVTLLFWYSDILFLSLYFSPMKPLIGLLLVISGMILAIPQIYDALSYVDLNRWPVVQGSLGIACVLAGLLFLVWGRGK